MEHGETVASAAHEAKPATTFKPRTTLGEGLWKLRQKIQTTEASLLDWDGVIREVQERRGEQDNERER
jgi:hypothetical protein